MHRKSISNASLWIKGNTILETNLIETEDTSIANEWINILSFPTKEGHETETSLVNHYLSHQTADDIFTIEIAEDYNIEGNTKIASGTHLFHCLDNFGVIHYHSSTLKDDRLNALSIKKLNVVFKHFKNSIIASLNQLKLEKEIAISKEKTREIDMISKFALQNPYPVMRFDSEGELIFGNDASQFILPHFEELKWAYATMFKKTLALNEMKVYEQVIHNKHYAFTVRPIQQYNYVNVYGMDISSRKIVEQKLKDEKEKAERLANIKMEFLSTMSHEIRTPMNSIIGSINLLFDSHLNDYQHKKLNMMQFAADNLLRLINEILDFNKLEANKVNLEKIRFSLTETLENVFAMHIDNAEKKNITFELELEKIPVEYVVGDPTRLSQILLNLISNAIKFTDKGGVKVNVQSTFKNDYSIVYEFKVIDTGIGISKEKINNIFQAFTQEDTSTTRRFGGTGLGLSISKKLVNLLEGSLDVESEIGKGTSFIAKIPYQISPNQKKEEKKKRRQVNIDPQQDLRNVDVLLVDDNEFNVLIATEFLSRWHANIITARNGQEAIDQLKSNNESIKIILMDLQMPVMDGFEATKMIRSFEKDYYKNLPIIALTADVTSDDIHGIENKGFNDFASKPFDPEKLLKKLLQYI
ncbi:response regulator [Flammeovirga sp. MY04]|uniref:ATP-binding protein n=1 Tax=Flammeovirga sp. MY04 TaxID=1191459 RepID=UPI00080620E1|nr:ATP-binding protein [Flammeovirga sp. MY04]ANQ49164.1 response regulator [Flammeovirga sp. MY04]